MKTSMFTPREEGLRLGLSRVWRPRPHVAPELLEELIYLSGRTQSLDELIMVLPERIIRALQLRRFIFCCERKIGTCCKATTPLRHVWNYLQAALPWGG
jgi:hypothetical protein